MGFFLNKEEQKAEFATPAESCVLFRLQCTNVLPAEGNIKAYGFAISRYASESKTLNS